MSTKLNRRYLLGGLGTLVALGALQRRFLLDKLLPGPYKGKVLGANFKRGHHLILKNLPKATRKEKLKVAIIGSGVGGLSSAYHLAKYMPQLRPEEVALFELENHLGGNSHSMDKKAPWGAHYLPLPNPDNLPLIQFLEEAEILKKRSQGTYQVDPYMLVGAPSEKLFIFGRFQEGLVPNQNLSSQAKSDIAAFFKLMKELTYQKGDDGLFLFNIPMEKSSKDPKWQALDKMSFKDYLIKKGWHSDALHWYTNYCCRDDYGTEIQNISAWAGLHYFCSRRPLSLTNPGEGQILTWPEGNNFLIQKLKAKIPYLRHSQVLCQEVNGNTLTLHDFKKAETFEVEAEQIILAVPQYIQKHLSKGLNQETPFEYTPWLVANILIKWDDNLERQLAWDNVNYHGHGLGFILSHQQSLKGHHQDTWLTYYWPLSHKDPKEARKWALKRTHQSWTEDILKDLEPMIFDIRERIKQVEVWPWGHAMVAPKIDFLFGKRDQIFNFGKHVKSAHSDLSGLSLFEEAFERGRLAAYEVSRDLGI